MLSLNNVCIAEPQHHTYQEIKKIIDSKEHGQTLYNPSKSAALIDLDLTTAVYINFKAKKTYTIVFNWSSVAFEWLSDDVARVASSCGTGCAKEVIFIAPATVVSCGEYNREVEFDSEYETPPISNHALLIDPKRKIFVCYDHEHNIQVFPFPITSTIYPPEGFSASFAQIDLDDKTKLNIHYEKKNEDEWIEQYDLNAK